MTPHPTGSAGRRRSTILPEQPDFCLPMCIRHVTLIAMTAAERPISTPAPRPPWYQFNIRSLLVLTTFAAILCSLGVCTHWGVSVVFGIAVVIAGIAGRIGLRTPARTVLVCLGAIVLLVYISFHRSSAVIEYEPMCWPGLYFATLWANWNLFGSARASWLKWLGRIVATTLLFPIYAFIILIVSLCVFAAMGGRIPFG